MAKKDKKDKKEKKEKATPALIDAKFTKKNMMFFGIGIVLVVLGFIFLSTGDTILAPILLVIGYLVFFPLGILAK